MKLLQGAVGLVVLATSLGVGAHGAHEHGVVKLDIAIEAGRITLQMESPLDNLIGFEHTPRNDTERRRAAVALTTLRAADKIFRIDPAAGCTLAQVELTSAPLQLGNPEAGAAEDGHGDLDGDFEFRCKDTAKATFIDIGLFSAFEATQRVEVQVAAPRGQLQRTLRRPAARVDLTR